MADQPDKISAIRARGGLKMPLIRTIMLVSVVLAVVGMIWAFMRAPEATQPDQSTTATTPAS